MTWRDQAVCQDMADATYAADDPFFPRGKGHTSHWEPAVEAKNACAACPVQSACLRETLKFEKGLPASARHGYFGGTTPYQRAKLDPKAPRIDRRAPLTADARKVRDELHQAGASDIRIAEELGVTTQSITSWRSQMMSAQTNAYRTNLWEKGYTDRQIAQMLGEETSTIKKWRARRKLAANGPSS